MLLACKDCLEIFIGEPDEVCPFCSSGRLILISQLDEYPDSEDLIDPLELFF